MTTQYRRTARDWLYEAQAQSKGDKDPSKAEAAFRGALKIDSNFLDAALGLSELLLKMGRAEEAVALLSPYAAREKPEHRVLIGYAEAQRTVGRSDHAALTYRRAIAAFPGPIAQHNLAAVLGDMAQFEEAEALSGKALAGGLDAPQTKLIRARALQGIGRLAESEAAYRDVLVRMPLDPEAWRELTQLIWMRTGDVGQALAPLDAEMRTQGPNPRLLETRAIALKFCGDDTNALETIEFAADRFPQDGGVRIFAAHMSIRAKRFSRAMEHVEAAIASQPGFWAQLCLAEVLLATGDAGRASGVIEDLRRQAPLDQIVIAYQALAWRLLGDERYEQLYDYSTVVSAQPMDTPKGWSTLNAYLADLKTRLQDDHRMFTTHPFQQSLVNGSQINNLIATRDPVIAALFEALEGPISRYVSMLGTGPDPLRSRNTTKTRFEGLWSVQLRGGGRHTGHVHQKGWLSSAAYIALPDAVTTSSRRAGWLKFGEPGITTSPSLGPEHFIKPEPGLLALFPSYMWHGTESFEGHGERLSVAFDLLPA